MNSPHPDDIDCNYNRASIHTPQHTHNTHTSHTQYTHNNNNNSRQGSDLAIFCKHTASLSEPSEKSTGSRSPEIPALSTVVSIDQTPYELSFFVREEATTQLSLSFGTRAFQYVCLLPYRTYGGGPNAHYAQMQLRFPNPEARCGLQILQI